MKFSWMTDTGPVSAQTNQVAPTQSGATSARVSSKSLTSVSSGSDLMRQMKVPRRILSVNGNVMRKSSLRMLWCVHFVTCLLMLTRSFCQVAPQTITLTQDDDESTVMVEARYIPVPIKLEPRESLNSTPFPTPVPPY